MKKIFSKSGLRQAIPFLCFGIGIYLFLIALSFHQAKVRPYDPGKARPATAAEIQEINMGMGSAVNEKQQPFEDFIKELSLVAKNDTIENFGTHPVDMAARKLFFTNEGWSEYEVYVVHLRKFILTHGARAKIKFKYASQKYDVSGTKNRFDASFNLEFCTYDMCDENRDQFQIYLNFTGSIDDPKHIRIDSWLTTF